jgi:hypothetical protein
MANEIAIFTKYERPPLFCMTEGFLLVNTVAVRNGGALEKMMKVSTGRQREEQGL